MNPLKSAPRAPLSQGLPQTLPQKSLQTLLQTSLQTVLLLALLCQGGMAWAAQVAGTVVNLSGPLLAKRADGSAKILALKSEVEQGDTLVTEKNTYAMIKFIDNSEITLRPGTTFTVDKFSFDADKPDGDSAAFNLLKGGLRSITGLLGKRNRERFSLKTPTATIGIRGTTFVVQFVPPTETEQALAAARLDYRLASTAALEAAPAAARSDAPATGVLRPLTLAQNTPPPSAPGLAPGLYVHVLDGMINVSNGGGTQNFMAGQFGFTPSFKQAPLLVPTNPGIRFTPPPAFSSSSAKPASSGAPAAAIDCVVR